MSKKHRIVSLFVCLLLALTVLAVPALAAPSDFTVTVSTDVDNAKQGDIVTVNVAVSGAQFCGVDMELSYDTESFDYVSSMSGWSDDGAGRLRLLSVNGSGGYWGDGKVIGTFKFAVKDTATAGEAAFCVGKDRDVFIVGDWAEGASSEPAKPLESHQLINTAVNVTGEQGENESLSDFGAISDDGSTLNLEAGHHVYSIPDSENGQVVWQSSDESVVTVDENGLVTAVSDGKAIITATDKDGNELEQRTVIVGEMPIEQEEAGPSDDPANKNAESSDTRLIVIAAVAVLAIVAVAATVVSKKRKREMR